MERDTRSRSAHSRSIRSGAGSTGRIRFAVKVTEGRADLVSVSRPYISNPDVVGRVADGLPWAGIRERGFRYTCGPRGYVDYPRQGERPRHGEDLVAPLT